MNNPWKLLFFILFTWTEINVAHSSSNNLSKYDLTDILNDAIVRVLKSNVIVEELESLIIIDNNRQYDGIHEINNTEKIPPFGNTIHFHTIIVFGFSLNTIRSHYHQRNTIRWEFSKNELRMFYNELEYTVFGYVNLEKPQSIDYLSSDDTQIEAFVHRYKNFSVTATKPSTNLKDDKNISIDMSYDHLSNDQGIQLDKSRKIPYEHQLKLTYSLSLELPSITRHIFNAGGNLSALLGEMFNLHPKQHVITAFPDFPAEEERYYYLIPDISFGNNLSLKNITIRGLTNFQSFVNNRTLNKQALPFYTLNVANVTGNMTLEAGFDHLGLSCFQLSFVSFNFYISYVPDGEKFRVEAQDYFIVEDAPRAPTLISSWLSNYSTSIMKVIESSIEALIIPLKEAKNNTDAEKSIPLTPHLSEIETSFMELLNKSATEFNIK
ncbi:uncharacterized protein LOC135837103 [Planococcus citri]|uniref:uncharacterized protein LOC135837103 n=1 Tax=Planococcus citri TaxID=170843 RepID=UPI0031F88F2E